MNREGLIAKSLLEEAEKTYQVALDKQTVALRNVAVTRAEVARAKAQVAQGQAALERSEEDLRNSTIVSPMDGLVLSRNVEVGDAVSSILVLGSQATLVMTLGDVSSVYVLGKVDEADIGKVYLGQPTRIVVESFKDKKYEGKVTKISPLGVEKDNVTTFEVRASIHNPDGELKANMTANAEIVLEEKKNVLIVPEAAVAYDKDRKTFLDIPDAKAEKGKTRVAVKLGISNGVKTELIRGQRRRPGCLAMTFKDLLRDTLQTLWSHKLRTLLTMFGIAWGIISIILMVGAGEGLRVGASPRFGRVWQKHHDCLRRSHQLAGRWHACRS